MFFFNLPEWRVDWSGRREGKGLNALWLPLCERPCELVQQPDIPAKIYHVASVQPVGHLMCAAGLLLGQEGG